MSKVKVTFEFDTEAESVKVLDIVRRAATSAPVGDPAAPFGRDRFGTPYESERDRERGENSRANDEGQVADDAVLQPGALDIRTMDAEDLLFYGTFSGELGGKVGPHALESAFVNWWQYGTAPMPELPATADVIDRRVGYDWTPYRGPLRAVLAAHRGVTDL